MNVIPRLLILLAVLAFAPLGCDSQEGSTDASSADTADAGGEDTSTSDTGEPADTAAQDTQVADSGSADTSTQDTQVADTGSADTGSADTGSADTGSADTGSADTGSADTGGLPDGPASDRHTAVPLSTTEAPSGFWEYLPPGYGDGSPRPLLVFWHGLGENGDGETQLNRVVKHGPPKEIEADAWPSDRPFVVLSPQNTGGGCPGADKIQRFLTWAIDHYTIDPKRVYLTGLSCGAIGSWNYLGKYLDSQVVAYVGIAGDGRSAWNNAGCDLGKVAIWGFHGDNDGTVNVNGTLVPMTNLIEQCPAPPRQEAILTIYEGVGHNSWTRTYNGNAGHDIYTWMLGFQKP